MKSLKDVLVIHDWPCSIFDYLWPGSQEHPVGEAGVAVSFRRVSYTPHSASANHCTSVPGINPGKYITYYFSIYVFRVAGEEKVVRGL